MKSPVLFGFYFCISFVLMFAWINLSKGEMIPEKIQLEEHKIEVIRTPKVIRTPNIPRHTQVLASESISDTEQSTEVEKTSEYKPTSEINEIPTPSESKIEILDNTPSETLTSAPEKFILKVLTSSTPTSILISNYKAILGSPKFESKVTPLTLELVDDRNEPRGRMTADMISLVVPLTTASESIKVCTHELGHVVDIQYLKPSRFGSDTSEIFYKNSWLDTSTKKPKMELIDFVSGYAMTNKYEDFSESFNYYLFHNNDFAKRSKSSTVLKNKYNFFKKYVFIQQEFIGTGFELDPIPTYNWDTTKIPIALNKYLFYIK